MTVSKDNYQQLLSEALMRADHDIGELRARIAEHELAASELSAELATLQAQHADCEAECRQLRVDFAGVTDSLSWRATTPLRVAAAWARALRGRE